MSQYPVGIAFDHLAAGASHVDYLLSEYFLAYTAAGGESKALVTASDGTGNRRWVRMGSVGGFGDIDIKLLMPGTQGFKLGFRYIKSGSNSQVWEFRFINAANNEVFNFLLTWSTGQLQVRRGATVLGSINIPASGYLELSFWVDDTVGEVNIQIDGGSSGTLDVAGIDLVNNAGPVVALQTVVNANRAANNTLDLTDIIVDERAAVGDPEFFGPLRGNLLRPSSDVSANWTRNAGASNAAAINEATSDGDTTYLETNVDTTEDQFEYDDLGAGITGVVFLSHVSIARAPNGGAPLIEHTIENNAVKVSGPQLAIGNVNYRTFQTMHYLAGDGTPLSVAKVNAMRLGHKAVV